MTKEVMSYRLKQKKPLRMVSAGLLRNESIEQMQKGLDRYLKHDNNERPHHGRNMNGRVAYQVFIDGLSKIKSENEKTTREAA
jgi:hypothetical protein